MKRRRGYKPNERDREAGRRALAKVSAMLSGTDDGADDKPTPGLTPQLECNPHRWVTGSAGPVCSLCWMFKSQLDDGAERYNPFSGDSESTRRRAEIAKEPEPPLDDMVPDYG